MELREGAVAADLLRAKMHGERDVRRSGPENKEKHKRKEERMKGRAEVRGKSSQESPSTKTKSPWRFLYN